MTTQNFGVTTSDVSIHDNIIRDLLYLQAESMMVFSQAVTMRSMPSRMLQLTLPKNKMLEPEMVAEGALAGFQHVEWFDVREKMDKYQTRVRITDEAKADGLANVQTEYSLEAAARGLAWTKDTEIKTALLTAVNTGAAKNYYEATACWDNLSSADIAGDIAKGIGNIFEYTNITEQDIQGLYCFYPATLWGYLAKPVQVGTLYTPMDKWIQDNYKVTFIPTRQLTDDALLVMKTPETAVHMTYNGSDIPTSETERIVGIGNDYVITQLFKSFIIPTSSTDSYNYRIQRIYDVVT